jgi:allantoin racemase
MRSAVQEGGADAERRLLVINPNSNTGVTEQIRRVAARALGPGVTADVVNPVGTPHAIETRADREAAEPEVVGLIEAGVRAGYSGYVLACFDDIAVEATRGHVGAPVVCAVEASLVLARSFARRIGIVTTVEAAVPRIRTLVARYGFADACSVRAAGVGVAAAASLGDEAQDKVVAAINAAVRQDGAEVIILGSGGLAGHDAALAQAAEVWIIDSIAAAVAFASAAALVAPMNTASSWAASGSVCRGHRGEHAHNISNESLT